VNGPLRDVLDTDMCVYLLNGDERVKTRVAEVAVGAICVAVPSEGTSDPAVVAIKARNLVRCDESEGSESACRSIRSS
jgi:hypothetical protein